MVLSSDGSEPAYALSSAMFSSTSGIASHEQEHKQHLK